MLLFASVERVSFSCVWDFLTGVVKQKWKKNYFLHHIPYQWKLDSSFLSFKFDPFKALGSFHACQSNWQNPEVFACKPGLAVASDGGRVRYLGQRHLEWHNSTALANSAVHIMGNFQIKQRLPRSSCSGICSTWFFFTLLFLKRCFFPECPVCFL